MTCAAAIAFGPVYCINHWGEVWQLVYTPGQLTWVFAGWAA